MTLPRPRHGLVGITVATLAMAAVVHAQNSVSPPASAPITGSATVEIAAPVVTGATTSKKDVSNLKHYVITDYGAVADGKTLNTASIQKAIDTAAAAGGGVLEIPKGTFMSGSIFLKQGVDLYLDDGAVLLGSPNIEDYPKQMTRIEGHFEPWRLALVNVWNMSHVHIGGTGQLNGNGVPFWTKFYDQRRADPATTNLGVERARLMFIDHCDDVRVENISFQDSQFWNLHLFHSHDVLVSGLRINALSALTGGQSPSTDGIDVDSCQNITIQSCQISNNDDDIALKGSKGPHADLLADNPPDENILIQNCTIGDGNGLLTCGSEATIVRNVLVRNCNIYGGAKMLTLKLRPDTPQHYSYITLDGITLNGTGSMINVAPWTQFFDLQGQPGPARSLDHIVVRNITGNFGSFGSIRGNVANPQRGTSGDTISDFTIENINVNLRNPGFSRGAVNNFVFNNVVVNGQPVAAPAATTGGGFGRRGGAGANAAPGAGATSATPAANAPTAPTTATPAQ